MTTPKQIAYKLERYAGQHPETQLQIFEIPQIPGYRRPSRSNKSIAESLTTTAYAAPLAIANPYLAGSLFVDYVVRGHHHLIPKKPQQLTPENLFALTAQSQPAENPLSAGEQAPNAASGASEETDATGTAQPSLTEIRISHE
jgi:hypothetical protein